MMCLLTTIKQNLFLITAKQNSSISNGIGIDIQCNVIDSQICY